VNRRAFAAQNQSSRHCQQTTEKFHQENPGPPHRRQNVNQRAFDRLDSASSRFRREATRYKNGA
jgi:hypothetical protein